jgi:AraC-like DNA-binding protein
VRDSPFRGYLLTTVRHTAHAMRSWGETTHPNDELVWSTTGVVTVRTSAGVMTVPSNRAVWVPSSVPHAVDAAAETVVQATFFATGVTSLPRAVTSVELTPAVRELLLLNASAPMEETTRMRLQRLVIDLLQPLPGVPVDLQMPQTPSLLGIAEEILAHLDADVTTADWARRLGLSARQLSLAFVDETGLSLTQWRIRARVRTSLLLLGSGATVAATARRLGYSSVSTFISHFRQVVGSTPGAHFRARSS